MKSFTLCVVLVTLLCFFINTLETKGQLSFNPPGGFSKTGRSLYQVSTELFQSTRDKLRSDIFASWLLQGRRGWGSGWDRGIRTSRFPYPTLPLPVPLIYLPRLPPLSILLSSPAVNKDTQNPIHLVAQFLGVSFSFFSLFSALALLLFRQLKRHHFMTYDVISVKGFPMLPEVSLSFFSSRVNFRSSVSPKVSK